MSSLGERFGVDPGDVFWAPEPHERCWSCDSTKAPRGFTDGGYWCNWACWRRGRQEQAWMWAEQQGYKRMRAALGEHDGE